MFMITGHKGSSATHRCAWCHSSRADQVKSPTPKNRQWHSRTVETKVQGSISHLTNTNEDLQKSQKRLPLLHAGCERLCIPTLHVNLGPLFNIFTGVMRIVTRNCKNHDSMTDYNDALERKHRLSINLHNHKQSLKLLEEMDNEYEYDETFVNDIPTQTTILRQKIKQLKTELKEAEKEFNQIQTKLKRDNAKILKLSLYKQLKINPWDVKKGSMTGIAGKNFINKHDIVLNELKKCDEDCYKLVKPLCVRLKFWCRVTWTKHLTPFSDNFLKCVEWQLHEIQWLYHNFIIKYGGGGGERFGIKIHAYYHEFEYMQHTRMSPAEIDDQRIEAWNAYVAQFAPIFQCFGGKNNLRKMIWKIWRQFVVHYDPANNNYIWTNDNAI